MHTRCLHERENTRHEFCDIFTAFFVFFIFVLVETLGWDPWDGEFSADRVQQKDDPLLVQQGIVPLFDTCVSLTTRFGCKSQVPKLSL